MIKFIVIGYLRGTCTSVEMLKGYMVRERLGTPGLNTWTWWGAHFGWRLWALARWGNCCSK